MTWQGGRCPCGTGGQQGLSPTLGWRWGSGQQVRGPTASSVRWWPLAREPRFPRETGDLALGSASRITHIPSCVTLAKPPLFSGPHVLVGPAEAGLTEKEGVPSLSPRSFVWSRCLDTEHLCEVVDKDVGVVQVCRAGCVWGGCYEH